MNWVDSFVDGSFHCRRDVYSVTSKNNNNNNNKQLVERISQRLQGALQPKNYKYAKRAMIVGS